MIKLINYITFFIFSLSLIGCCKEKSMYEDRFIKEIDTDDLSSMVIGFATELSHQRNHLFLEQAYVVYNKPETKIRLEFSSQGILTMGEARHLLVDIVEGLLDRINDTALAAEVLPNPFTADNLEIYIDLQSFHGEFVDPFYVGWIVLEKGHAFYYAFTLKNQDLDFWHVRQEPYFKSRSFTMFERAAEENYQRNRPKRTSSLLQQERYQPLIHP